MLTGEWRKLHNEELSALYSSLNIIQETESRTMEWAGLVARMGARGAAYSILVKIPPDGKRQFGSPRRK
jgi:hypothetical protein